MRLKKHASATGSSDLMVEKKKVRTTTRRRSSNGVVVDLISELPDTIIHHILSYLDMTTVFQTSFLSKRWRYLWTTLPFLNFDYRVYRSCSTFCRGGILDFVDRVLIFRNQNSNVHSFRFSYGEYDDCNLINHISTWILILIRSNVQVIDLQFDSVDIDIDLLELPMSLFTCKSLTVLKLDFGNESRDYVLEPCIRFQIPAAASLISLPCLKTLHLESLTLMNSVELLISRCPVLETLIINYCFLDGQELNICNPQIKSLVISKVKSSRPHESSSCGIKVFAPNLMSFRCTDYIGYFNRYSFVNNSSLVKAEIDIDIDSYADDFKGDIYPAVTRKNVIDCLRGICNVRSLILSTWLFEFVTEVPDRLESLQINPFCNLSYLKLETSLSKPQIAVITYLLEKCPNLEYLVLKVTHSWRHKARSHAASVEWWEAELAPQCMMHHLKLIEIWDVEASVNELEFLKFLLNNAVVLEKMIVFTSEQQLGYNCKRFRGFRKKLISFRGASSSSEIVFVIGEGTENPLIEFISDDVPLTRPTYSPNAIRLLRGIESYLNI